MIRCIAIDDEPLALELLEDNISKVPFLQLVAACDNALDAMKIMEKEPVDLIFLDIQMPGLTGLQFINSMTAKPMIILITAYEKYALEGFNLAVTDYLVKPVSLDRFVKACYKAKEFYDLKHSVKESTGTPNDYFFVNVEYSLVKISLPDIVYVEGLKDYIKIHLKSSTKPVVTRMPMKTIEEQLPSKSFVRIHKSYIVAVAFITSIRKTSVFIDSTELPVSELYREAITTITNR
ncbi:LytTR family DNA-binding domain-containing protein [Ferruginibacter sp. HRS2-29]|uniref:LytR/AlgR family response regulator transcription factor n=1 Tax=Ferruginibacter sp. HRS2-29 TaxID=2487334 RepID=UPI0020CBB900|nr:LytTR family DNA-binding domain-containing protein [Ferruginibacter sp. HRS2-29]MCP9749707.1 DNA-binding response regulator [Ferruginibacter sp. HRS2-29]